MKEVIKNNDLREVIMKATNMICDATSSTLGPSGNNVLINTDDLSPYITNDGVTIAESISSDDKKINTVLEIIKEASLKTNEVVGDGTTTTLVLLQALLNEGFKEIDLGKKAIVLKKELYEALDEVIKKLNKLKRKPTKKDLVSIASIAANDKEIGLFITNLYKQVKSKNAIKLSESPTYKTYYELKKGYSLEIDNISNLYFKENNEINLNNVNILLLHGYLENFEQISSIINEGLLRNKNIVIFANDFNEILYQEVSLYYLQHKKNIYLFKIPDYGSRQESILEDISVISSANIKNINYETVYWSDLGYIENVIIKHNEIILLGNKEKMEKRLKELSKELLSSFSSYEKDFITSRMAKLDKGIITIYVGGITKTEIREKIMRFEDALCVLEVAKNGVVVGEGITLLKISDILNVKTIGDKIMQKVLQVPFQKILENCGENYILKKEEIIKNNYNKIYNLETGELEDIDNTNIIDPVNVVIETLKNAISIASLLLTTNYLVINENYKYEKNEI